MYSVQIRFLMTSRENDLSAGSHVRRKHNKERVNRSDASARTKKENFFPSSCACACVLMSYVWTGTTQAQAQEKRKYFLSADKQTNISSSIEETHCACVCPCAYVCLTARVNVLHGTNTCTYISAWVVRVNQPLEVYSRSMQYMPRHCWWQLDLECNSKSLTLKLAQLVYRKFWFIYMWIKLISIWKDIEVSLALKQRRKATRNRHWEHALFLLFLFLSFLLLHLWLPQSIAKINSKKSKEHEVPWLYVDTFVCS